MPGEDIQSWSTTAANNGNADSSIIWSEGQARASVNNSSRSEMAAHAKNRNLLNGSIVTFGTANAQQFLSGVSYTAVPTGLVVKLKIGAGLTNVFGTVTTLNMDSIGDVEIKTADGVSLQGNELMADGYVDLLYNGTNWIFLYSREFIQYELDGGGGVIIGHQIFATPGSFTYTPTPGTQCCIIECIGGGGGGGSALGTGTTFRSGGGGGGGGYSRIIASAADIGGSKAVTVGAGGIGGVGSVAGNDGGMGGATALGSLCGANGGYGGTMAIDGAAGGAGALSGTGAIAAAGNAGGAGTYTSPDTNASGQGGNGPFGGGAVAVFTSLGAGVNAGNYGAGGSGGGAFTYGLGASGGNGSAGVVIITEFAGRGAPGVDGVAGAPGPIGPTGPSGPGTGDVLRSGTPVAGQIAQWTDASHIAGVSPLFTTGDIKLTIKTVADAGWVLMNDGTIGNASSGATARANADTVTLFTLIYTNIPTAALFDSTGASVARGASAAADYAANRRLQMLRVLGRSLAIAGAGASLTARTLGDIAGEETHTQTIAEMPAHNHYQFLVINNTTSAGQYVKGVGDSTGPSTDAQGTASTGGGAAFNVVDPTTYLNVMIKL